LKCKGRNPLGLSIWSLKIHEGQVGDGRHKEKMNEGEYGGCILYSYLKIEELNLLKLF
jgi:hypothetical protein